MDTTWDILDGIPIKIECNNYNKSKHLFNDIELTNVTPVFIHCFPSWSIYNNYFKYDIGQLRKNVCFIGDMMNCHNFNK